MKEPTCKVSYDRSGEAAKAVRLLASIGRTPREAVVGELKRMARAEKFFTYKGSRYGSKKRKDRKRV